MAKRSLHAIAVEHPRLTSISRLLLWKLIDGSDYTGLVHIKGWNYTIIIRDTRFTPWSLSIAPRFSFQTMSSFIMKMRVVSRDGNISVYDEKQYLIIKPQVKLMLMNKLHKTTLKTWNNKFQFENYTEFVSSIFTRAIRLCLMFLSL